jgi:hypothetical protein
MTGTKKKQPDLEDEDWEKEVAAQFLDASLTLRQMAVDAAGDQNGRLARDLMVGAAVGLDKTLLLVGKKPTRRGTTESRVDLEKRLKALNDQAAKRSTAAAAE